MYIPLDILLLLVPVPPQFDNTLKESKKPLDHFLDVCHELTKANTKKLKCYPNHPRNYVKVELL